MIHGTKRTPLLLILQGVILSLIVNLGSLGAYLSSQGLSPRAFSDWDEPVYLSRVLDGYSKSLSSLVSLERGIFPQSIVDISLGKFALSFDLEPLSLGMLLDLIVPALSYVIFVYFFLALSSNRLSAQLASLVTVCLPWLFTLSQYVHIPITWSEMFTSARFWPHPCLPVLRGPYTQLAYPLFGVALWSMAKGLRSTPLRLSWFFCSGVFSGLLIYVYFFAWGAALGVTLTVIVLGFIVGLDAREGSRLKAFGGSLGSFLLAHIAVAAFGFLLVGRLPQLGGVVNEASSGGGGNGGYFSFWFVSVENSMLLTVLFLLAFRYRFDSSRFIVLITAGACLISEFVLMNVQPVIKSLIQPFHFSLFYLHPLLGGLIVFFLASLFQSRVTRLAFACILIGAALLVSGGRFRQRAIASPDIEEFTQLARYLEEKTPKESVVAVIPFLDPFDHAQEEFAGMLLPYWIKAIARRNVFPDFDGMNRPDMARQELTLGCLYTGKMQLVASCPKSAPELPGDIFKGALTAATLQRIKVCEKARSFLSSMPECERESIPQIDYVLWEKNHKLLKPDFYSAYFETVWTSSGGAYQLLAWRIPSMTE